MRSLPKVAALAAATALAAACSDVTAPPPPATAAAPQTAPTAVAAGSLSGVQGAGTPSAFTSALAPDQCVDVWGGGTEPGTPVVIWPCHSGANQQFTWLSTGELKYGELCLDAYSGQGNDLDAIVAWPCHGGANQRWAATAAGEIRGIHGKCLDVLGGNPAAGTPVILYTCHGGSNQHWTPAGGGSPPPAEPAPPAPPAQPAPPSGGAAAVFGLMGTAPSVAEVEGWGGAFARYESEFRRFADQHWANQGPDAFDGNYYDRAMIYYVWWARTGNPTYLERANAHAVQYRRDYLEARNFVVLPHEAMLDGVALHYLVTGDEASRTAVGRVADRLIRPGQLPVLADPGAEIDNRVQARILTALILARRLDAPSQAGHDWSARAREALNNVLQSQAPDGAYRFTHPGAGQCGYNKPWMVGLLNDALVRYYTTFEADGRIVGSVRRAVDYMWERNWDAGNQGFVYLEGHCNGDGPIQAGDINNLISSGFGFVYRQTGDATYRTRGDAVFAGGVVNAWLPISKQFNQQYTSSYRYLSYR